MKTESGSQRARLPAEQLLRVSEVSQRLACSPRAVWRMVSAGRLTPVKLLNVGTRFKASEVEALVHAAGLS